ncbi:nitrogen regulatory IIA protein [Empedobacter brevis]|uniref:nitrogen regulatory IIA protein n=1 Tax=Empedobacter brevis TaxID=247 RepID=UPI00289E540A|nr:nitrogen regulatory IIA protein [Empedobacter brevis]
MKNLKLKLRNYLKNLDKNWQMLTLEKQHQYLLTFFLGYGLLNTAVFINIGYDVVTTNKKLQIEHIQQPFQKSKQLKIQLDSLITIYKNDWYEGE